MNFKKYRTLFVHGVQYWIILFLNSDYYKVKAIKYVSYPFMSAKIVNERIKSKSSGDLMNESPEITTKDKRPKLKLSESSFSFKRMQFISWYFKFTESVLLNYLKMPATPYDLVKEDTDIRGSPLHSEQAFLNGITFRAKVSTKLFFIKLPFSP